MEAILIAVRAIEEREEALSAKRAIERDRKRRQRAQERDERGTVTGQSRDMDGTVTDTASLSLPPNEINSNPPTHTHPVSVSPRARKADPFPKPEWADCQHWDDLKSNRKAKRLPNTPTAHAKLLRDIEQWVTDDWPPGRLLEAIAALGWASAQYDPRGNNHGHSRNVSILPTANGRGTRPDPCLDMLRFSQTPDSEEHFGDDLSAWPSLPAIGSG